MMRLTKAPVDREELNRLLEQLEKRLGPAYSAPADIASIKAQIVAMQAQLNAPVFPPNFWERVAQMIADAIAGIAPTPAIVTNSGNAAISWFLED